LPCFLAKGKNHQTGDTMRGFLYSNGDVSGTDRPHYTGSVVIDGKEWRLAAWAKRSAAGAAYLSLAASEPAVAPTAAPQSLDPVGDKVAAVLDSLTGDAA
jgi:uncharacterized protein (DUF736 family)